MLAAMAAHEYERFDREAPGWTSVEPLETPWIPEHPFLSPARVEAQTPSWLRTLNIYVPARDLITVNPIREPYEFDARETAELLAELDRRLRERGVAAAVFVVGGAAIGATGATRTRRCGCHRCQPVCSIESPGFHGGSVSWIRPR
ncbi:hypothetical protein [Nocardioides dongkuii]|uniref:hypothetical protein n=1 Tax=Nocardioides dongkuii TaxID=2760089 RepID=UPI0018778187|nr:hypothetical protein [Nocardioides dongkuii]